MKNMKISVIIPVYNVEKYLRECLESIVNQSYKNLEIIVVDDGSPDNSREIYNEYAAHDSRIKIIKQKNGGLSAARNAGIRAATGDWIHFIDSDDYLPNLDYYEKMIDAATDADADVACSGLYKEAKPTHSVRFKQRQVLTQIRDKFTKTRANRYLYVWRYLIKKSILDDNKITFEVGRIMEDVMFTTQILYYARVVVVVPHVLIFYRNNANSILQTKEPAAVAKMRADHRYAFESAQLFMSEHHIPIELGNWFQVRVRHGRRFIAKIKFKLFRIRLFLATRGTAIFGKKFYRNHHESINGRMVTNFFKKDYLSVIQNIQPETPTRAKTETLWQYWGQGIDFAPELVRACFATAEKYRGDRNHIIVDNKTLSHYADMPGYIHDRFTHGKMKFAHFADLVRLELLHNHGGYWIDATDYLTAEIPAWIADLNFFVFHAQTCGSPYSFIQNCFIRSDKGAFLLDAWRAIAFDYWRRESKAVDYFQHQSMFKSMVQNDPVAKKFYEQMPVVDQAPTHRMAGGEFILTKFDSEEYKRLTGDSFFQKLTYRLKSPPAPDSYAAKMIEMTK
ncbi:hypothetical protein AGMMS49982_12120 [Bacteroidia bacterium]|nr:hypothetical protein AGMMS49982_12120 [Bacteroidia bacterium]